MKTSIDYNDLERHFTAPKVLSPHYSHKRIPRKMKKKLKQFMGSSRYDFLTLNQKLWLHLGYSNPDYKTFLIKQICKD